MIRITAFSVGLWSAVRCPPQVLPSQACNLHPVVFVAGVGRNDEKCLRERCWQAKTSLSEVKKRQTSSSCNCHWRSCSSPGQEPLSPLFSQQSRGQQNRKNQGCSDETPTISWREKGETERNSACKCIPV